MRIGAFFDLLTSIPTEVEFSEEVDLLAVGSPANGTTQAIPVIPTATILAGMGILIHVSTKIQTAEVEVPTGFRRLPFGRAIHSARGNGADQGPIKNTILYMEAVGGETGSITIDVTNDNPTNGSIEATIYIISKAPEAYLHVDVVAGHTNTPNQVNHSARSWQKSHSKPGDKYLVAWAWNTDAYGSLNQNLTQTGVTFTETTEEIIEVGTTQGNDQEQVSSLYTVTDGDVTDYLTYDIETTGSAAANPIGICHFIRLRQSTTPQTFRSSGLNTHFAEDMVNATVAANGELGNGLAQDIEGGSSDFAIVTIGDDTYLRTKTDFTSIVSSGTARPRRREFATVPDKPAYPEGTKLGWGAKLYINNLIEPALQFIFHQIHTGSFGTAPHFPLVGYEIVKDGQYSGVPGGSLVIDYGMHYVSGAPGVSIRNHLKPQIEGSYISMLGTHTHWFKEIFLGHQTDGEFQVWYKNESMADYVQIVNEVGVKTIATTSEEIGDGNPGTGATPLVVGRPKTGVYDHQIPAITGNGATDLTNYNNSILLNRAVGHEIKDFNWKITEIVKDVTDIDYDDDTQMLADLHIP